MNKIKKRRMQLGLTQKELAEKMKTTQQTIARWEKEKSISSITTLRELAFNLETSVNALTGANFFGAQTTRYYGALNNSKNKENSGDELSGFWGHLGILSTKREKSVWYPITEETMDKAYNCLQEKKIFAIPCLNNKMIIVNPINIKRSVFLWEPCDAFPEDWETQWYDEGTYPLEIFSALERVIELQEVVGNINKDRIFEPLIVEAKTVIDTFHLSTEDIDQITKKLRIIYADGNIESYFIEDYSKPATFIQNTLDDLDEDQRVLIVNIEDEIEIFVNTNLISVVEFPLNKIESEFTKEYNEVMEDDNDED